MLELELTNINSFAEPREDVNLPGVWGTEQEGSLWYW